VSDPRLEETLYGSEPMRRIAEIESLADAIREETTVPRLHHPLK
jgi:hypothetical protein